MKKFLLPLVALFFFGVNAFAQPGTLDLTFNTDGIVLVNPTNVFDNAQDVIVLGDNKIFICGTTGMFTDFDMMVAKLNEDGSYDTSFGNNGVFTLANTAGSDFAYDMTLLPNGNILVVGAKSLTAADTQFAAWAIKPDGTQQFDLFSWKKIHTWIQLQFHCCSVFRSSRKPGYLFRNRRNCNLPNKQHRRV
jgi:uncharacterized delta-60 repeat protein